MMLIAMELTKFNNISFFLNSFEKPGIWNIKCIDFVPLFCPYKLSPVKNIAFQLFFAEKNEIQMRFMQNAKFS